jgi:hypothetical protein
MSTAAPSAERIAQYFVDYLFARYDGSRHVRRVASWFGFLIKAIERASGGELDRSRVRQLAFSYRDHRFKVKFNHKAGKRGGIEIIEVLPLQGLPEGEVAIRIRNLDEAEVVYGAIEKMLDDFIDHGVAAD